MARLNESASAPMESVELLKRRFLRQNKEIIRANSDQSIKIRTLEAEQSRLLSENITLREENIRLNHDLAKGRHALALENVGNVRHKLEIFAAGLGGLLAELTEASTKLPEPTPLHASAKRRSPKASPGQRSKPGLFLAHLTAEEGRLSPIVEGKHYPRKTLDTEELGDVTIQESAMIDSPDLGPPPVIRCDLGDPVKTSPSPSRIRDPSYTPAECEPRDAFLNLETRKKRRSSKDSEKSKLNTFLLPEVPRGDRSDDNEAQLVSKAAKAGGKRKLSMTEDETRSRPVENFEYTKKQSSQTKQSAIIPIRAARQDETKHVSSRHRKVDGALQAAPIRKALGEKPVNTDPMVSPVKTTSREYKEQKDVDLKEASVKIDFIRPLPPARPKSSASNRKAQPSEKPDANDLKRSKSVTQTRPGSQDPVTPAIADLPSPMEHSAPSTAGNLTSRDTPPPVDIHSRPSRRSRPAVSYAEPKLNVKMRREGKELVDAVSDDKSKRSTSLSGSLGPETKHNDPLTEALPNWNKTPTEVTSPLAPKDNPATGDADFPTTGPADRKRRSIAGKPLAEPSGEHMAAMEDKIAAIVNMSNRRLSRAREAAEVRSQVHDERKDHKAQVTSDQDVFDLVDSSSPEASLSNKSAPNRAHKRVSSVPEKLGRAASRRRETMATDSDLNDKDGTGDEVQGNGMTDAGRMMTRRKSMMV